jgi:hypothetical protein
MNRVPSLVFFLTALGCLGQSPAFTYQGRLTENNAVAAGVYDFRFTLRDAAAAGNQIGIAVTNSAVLVSNGVFAVTLDFGAGSFGGATRWLEIGVRTNGGAGAFVTLTPSQPITSTPYAIQALNSATVSGPVADAQLSANIPRLNLGASFTGTINFNPAAGAPFTVNSPIKVSNLNADLLDGLDSTAFWNRNGNAGTIAGTDFLGTTDNQPLEVKVNGLRALRLEPNSSGAPNVIAGAEVNKVDPGIVGATIAGGGATQYIGVGYTNRVGADFGVIGGGSQNGILTSAPYSTVSGGQGNTVQNGSFNSVIGGGGQNSIQTNAYASTIGGGVANSIQAGGYESTISGGIQNTIQTNSFLSTIGGGSLNTIQTNSYVSSIGGGQGNTIQFNASFSTIAGGYVNTIQSDAYYSTIAGGYVNTIQSNAFYSAIGGGLYNTNAGSYAVVPGGFQNFAAGSHSFAAGTRAKANHDGAFVWADSSASDFSSVIPNSFSVRAIGGTRFVSAIDGNGNPTAGVILPLGGASWSSISDRNAKKNFRSLDAREILEKLSALPIQRWNYKWEPDATVPHIGPVAQDFKAAFYPGRDDKSISTLEFDGVELAAIQGLNELLKEKEARISGLEKQNSELEKRLRAIEGMMRSLAAGAGRDRDRESP